MSKPKSLSFHMLGLALIVGLSLFLAFNQMWMIDRAVTSGYVFGMRMRGVFLFYIGEEGQAPFLLQTINEIEDYPIIFRDFDWNGLWAGVKEYFAILFSALLGRIRNEQPLVTDIYIRHAFPIVGNIDCGIFFVLKIKDDFYMRCLSIK